MTDTKRITKKLRKEDDMRCFVSSGQRIHIRSLVAMATIRQYSFAFIGHPLSLPDLPLMDFNKFPDLTRKANARTTHIQLHVYYTTIWNRFLSSTILSP